MSRDTRIDEVVKMAREVFGDNVDVKVVEVTPKKEDNTSEKNTNEGTLIPNSLISDEEKKLVTELVGVFDKLMNIHRTDDHIKRLLNMDKDDYVMLQYLMYLDHIKDSIEAIKGLNYVCTEMTKEHIDDVAKENDTTTKEMVIMGMMNTLKTMFG